MTTDGYVVEPGERIPVDLPARPAADTAARPAAGAAPRPATRRVAKRKPLRRSTVALAAVAGAGAAVAVVTGLAVTVGPIAALAAAVGVPMTVAARVMARGNRGRRAARRTTVRRQPGADRRTASGGRPGGLSMPRLPNLGKTSGGGAPVAGRSAGAGLGLPKMPGPRAAANGGRTPNGGPHPAAGAPPKRPGPHPAAGAPPKRPGPDPAAGAPPKRPGAGAPPKRPGADAPGGRMGLPGLPSLPRLPGRGRSSTATPGGQRAAAGVPNRPTRGQATPTTTTANGTGGIPNRKTRRPLRTPRTRLGHASQQKRLADQEQYLKWWGDRPAAVRQTTRKAVAAGGKAAKTVGVKTVNGMGSTGKAAQAGFKGGAKPRDAAKAAYGAARAARRPGVSGHVGSVAAGVVGAGLAATARGTANRAKPVGAGIAKATRATATRARKVRRAAADRTRNFGKRLLWVFTGNTEALKADRARAAREKAAKVQASADRKTARTEKYAVPRPQQAQPVAPQQPAPTTVQAPVRPAVTTNPRPQQATPIVVPAHGVGTGLTGGTSMIYQFPPYTAAAQLGASLLTYSPGDGEGALFAFYDAMTPMQHTAEWIQFGWKKCFIAITQDLNVHLSGAHVRQRQQAQRLFDSTPKVFVDLKAAFYTVHKADLDRRALRNAQVSNVQTGMRGDVAIHFPAWADAELYGKSLAAWRPGLRAVNLNAAKEKYYEALPYMGKASWIIANGWSEAMRNTMDSLRGGLRSEMSAAMTQIYRSYSGAAEEMDKLLTSFYQAENDLLERRERRGAHTANVPARVN